MELYVFPAVFYKDKEKDEYVVAFDDVEIYCSGKSIEEAFVYAKHHLTNFLKLSYKVFGKVQEKPRSYVESVKAHPKEIVLLIDGEVKPTPKKDVDDEVEIEIDI